MLHQSSKICGTRLKINGVRWPTKMPYSELLRFGFYLQQRFQIPEVLRPLQQHVPNESNSVFLIQYKRKLSLYRHRARRTRRASRIDAVLLQTRVQHRFRVTRGNTFCILCQFILRLNKARQYCETGEEQKAGSFRQSHDIS